MFSLSQYEFKKDVEDKIIKLASVMLCDYHVVHEKWKKIGLGEHKCLSCEQRRGNYRKK